MTYSRTATKEEIENLSEGAEADLKARFKEATLCMDQMTFGAYVVIDEVRYDIEATPKK